MRIKRSVTRFFMALILPALTIAVVGYFGSYAIWGERGLLTLEDAEAHLGMQQEKLAQVTSEHDRLAHRIQLMEDGHADPDLVEELARGRLMDGAPNQVAVPRSATH
ncbi:MAG TPA: septum formation initiator family protein [Rhizomicrobium sp.]|jgi:cell division protein FtsB